VVILLWSCVNPHACAGVYSVLLHVTVLPGCHNATSRLAILQFSRQLSINTILMPITMVTNCWARVSFYHPPLNVGTMLLIISYCSHILVTNL